MGLFDDLDALIASVPVSAPVAVDEFPEFSVHDRFGTRPAVRSSPDLTRSLALPRRPRVAPNSDRAKALQELMTERFALPATPDPCRCKEIRNDPAREDPCVRALNLAQAWTLYELATVGGVVGLIGVGHGKTVLDILAALAVPGCRVAVLLIPPGLRDQLVTEYLCLREHFRVPSLVMDDGRGYTVPGAPVLHVIPYSRLSTPAYTARLDALGADLVIGDEADMLKNRASARTRRVMRQVRAGVRFAWWSGSLMSESLKDMAHLFASALGEGSPLPLDANVVEEWSLAHTPSGWQAPAGALMGLCAPGEDLNAGIQRRLVETRGVVATTEASCASQVVFLERPTTTPPAVLEMIEEVRALKERPDGEELVEEKDVSACVRQLACGFFLRWRFPDIGGVPQDPEVIEDWRAKRKAWFKELRERLKRPRDHLDSPHLCTEAAKRAWGEEPYRGPLPVWKAESWPAWRDVMHAVVHETETVWVDDWLARDAAAWAREHRGIVWVENPAFGERIAQLAGVPYVGGGPDAADRAEALDPARSCVLSRKSHGRGRDMLQFKYHEQLFAQLISSGREWEQVLGRLARQGQTTKLLPTWVHRHVEEVRGALDAAVRRARCIEGTLGTAQHLISARYTFEMDPDAVGGGDD